MFFGIMIFVSLLGLALIQTNLWTTLTALLFQPSGYAFFRQHVYASIMQQQWEFLGVLMCRIGLLIYILFLIPCVFAYTCVFGYQYQETYWKQAWTLLRNPLLLPPFLCSWKGGMYTFIRNTPLALHLQSKEYWHQLFYQVKVPFPKVVGMIDGGTILSFTGSQGRDYLIKPVVGGLGKGIIKFDPLHIPSQGKYMIQERVEQKKPWHIRMVTVGNARSEVHMVYSYMLVSASSDHLTSNAAQGGSLYALDVVGHRMRHEQRVDWQVIPDDVVDVRLLQKIKEDAVRLHHHLPIDIIMVGWDIMVDVHGTYYFLEGNVPGGTLHSKDCMFYQHAVEIDMLIDDVVQTS